MTAPSLVLLGHGSHDPQVPQVSHQIREGLLAIRPELDIHVAFLDHCAPGGMQVVNKWSARVPRRSYSCRCCCQTRSTCKPRCRCCSIRCRPTSRSCGSSRLDLSVPEAQLLSIIDRRLRDALRARRVSELDGLVFAAAGSTDIRSNALVARRARQWATHHRLPCVTAFASGSGPSSAEAIRTLRGQARRHIAVGSWFLAPGLHYTRQAELAREAGAVAVSAPMGGEPEIAEVA